MELQIFRGHSTPSYFVIPCGLAKKNLNFSSCSYKRKEKKEKNKIQLLCICSLCIRIFLKMKILRFSIFYFSCTCMLRIFSFSRSAKIQFSRRMKMKSCQFWSRIFSKTVPLCLFRITMHTVSFSPVCVVNAFDSEVDLLMTYSKHFFHRLGD